MNYPQFKKRDELVLPFLLFERRLAPPHPHRLSCPVCSDRTGSFSQSQAKNSKQCRFSFPRTTIADFLPLSDLSQVFFFIKYVQGQAAASVKRCKRGVKKQASVKKVYAVLLFHFCPVFFPLFVIFGFLHFDFLRFRHPIILTLHLTFSI